MKKEKKGFMYEFIILCFHISSKIMRQSPHLVGKENLKDLPTPVIFTLTHDSYFEVPSLSRVYYALEPRPDFFIVGKDDFLSGEYLASNFGQKNRVLRFLLGLLDKTKLPEAVFNKMKIITIHRPFVEGYKMRKDQVRKEIGTKMNRFRDSVSLGLSTLIFPEGTTWGHGGLKRIRSIVYQLVENIFESTKKKVYLLPINVKQDRLVVGKKDIFINVGKPVFYRDAKERFNERVKELLLSLHTITFSQIAAYYLKRIAEEKKALGGRLVISKEKLEQSLEGAVAEINRLCEKKILPSVDTRLLAHEFLVGKVEAFIKYCEKKKYIIGDYLEGKEKALKVNLEKVLADYPEKVYRKQNPIGFHANELASLGEKKIRKVFDRYVFFPTRAD